MFWLYFDNPPTMSVQLKIMEELRADGLNVTSEDCDDDALLISTSLTVREVELSAASSLFNVGIDDCAHEVAIA